MSSGPTGRKKRKADSNDSNVEYPANKYGFHLLATKNKVQEGDNLKIPLRQGQNPTLPNPDFVLMEYLGRSETPKHATNWSLKTSTPVNCTAVGPKDFMKILEENGISGYPTRNFSEDVEIIRNGQSLGNITEMKERTLRA